MKNKLEKHIDHLFAHYRQTKETAELKSEMLSNLEARVADYTQNGMAYEDAVNLAIQNLDTIDFIADENQPIYINRFKFDLVQTGFIYILIGWILSIPLRMNASGIWVNTLFSFIVVIGAIIYVLLIVKRSKFNLNAITALNLARLARAGKAAWIVWGLFVAANFAITTALRFGSNLWFGQAIHLDGPYQFAVIAIDYLIPLFTIIVPLIFNKAIALAAKHEVTDR